MIWKRYLFLRTLKFSFLFLLAIFLLYTIVDLSVHSGRFLAYNKGFLGDIFLYYLHHLSLYLDLFLPLSLLLSLLKVLTEMNLQRELVILQTSGISSKTLSKPLFAVATIFSLFLLGNFEFFSPFSVSSIENFKDQNLRKEAPRRAKALQVILLNDSSKLIFQRQDEKKKELFDVFWIRSAKEFWHIKTLHLQMIPKGEYVDHFLRNKEGVLEKTSSFLQYSFQEMNLEKQKKQEDPPENRSLSMLLRQIFSKQFSFREERTPLLSHLYLKGAMALSPFLIVLSLFPYCVQFSRRLPIFLISAFALFFFLLFITAMDSATLLSENQTSPPFITIALPFLFILGISGKKFLQQA